MPRYRAHLTQRVWETATIDVEANSLEDAEESIADLVDDGNVDWKFIESDEWFVNAIEKIIDP